ncbi:MAG: CocE/NonD family hydrolase, partial [Verrucomicrobiota bacterium]
KIGGALGSYNSYTQLAIADELDVVLDVVSCANMYELIYPDGLYSLETVHNWAFNMDGGGLVPEAIRQSYRTLPLETASTKAYGKKNLFVDDWLKHEKYDAYWKKQDHKNISKATTFSFAGWYDIFLMGQIADFEALSPDVKAKSRLVIGPWAHGQHEIENDFGGVAAVGEFEQLSLKLLAASLKGEDPAKLFTAPLKDAQYNFFIMEKNEYFPSDTWPPKETKTTAYYLTPEGFLSPNLPLAPSAKEYVYDPADPYPSKGGTTLSTPAGQADQSANTNRADQLVFNLPIGEGPLTLLGPINARLFVETDAPCTDFFVLLQDVFPDGTVVNIQEGGAEYVPREEKIGQLDFSVWATGYQFNPGHTLRVVVTSSWFPRFNRNLNSGELRHSAQQIRIARQRLHVGGRYPSAITLPVLWKSPHMALGRRAFTASRPSKGRPLGSR